MRDDPRERRAIERLLEHLSPRPTTVDRWPDREDRTKGAIDAIAASFAIEHTCVDSFPGQSQDTSYFEAIAALETEIALPYRLSLAVPVGALKRGTDWRASVGRLRQWIVCESPALPAGAHSVGPPVLPFAVEVWKYDPSDQTWRPGLFLKRSVDSEKGFVEMLRAQASRKFDKLAPHKEDGLTTVLLLESRCGALMSLARMDDGLAEAFPAGLPAGIDQIWFADWACEAVPGYWRLR